MQPWVTDAFFVLFFSHFLHGFQLGGAVTEANVTYYPELRMVSRIQLNYALGYRSMLELNNHKMSYWLRIIYTFVYITSVYILLTH